MEYNKMLLKAAILIKNGESIPENVLERAIGKRPNRCGSPSLDTMMEELEENAYYQKRRREFLEEASLLAV